MRGETGESEGGQRERGGERQRILSQFLQQADSSASSLTYTNVHGIATCTIHALTIT